MALMASWSADMDNAVQLGEKFAGNVVLSAEGYEFEDGTRTALTNTGSKISFAWKNGEAIGIFPIAPTTNYQAKQTLTTDADGLNAEFNGAGWALLKGNTYAAYSPFNGKTPTETPYTAVPVAMTGQKQTGNASLKHIGDAYDYMYAKADVPSDGGVVTFGFEHVGAIAMLQLTMPEDASWKSATLTSESSVFISSCTMNVSNGSLASKVTSKSQILELESVSGKDITLYMAILPCTTGELTLTVTSSTSKEYTAKLVSKTLAAGKAYKWEASPKGAIDLSGTANGHEWVDLGIRKSMYDSSITPGSSADRRIVLATCNIGANSPEEYGYYFRWGELCGWEVEGANSTTNSISLSSSNCKQIVPSGKSYAKETYASNTFYSSSTGNTSWALCGQSDVQDFQGKTNLTCNGQVYGDAARYNWGGDWMMMNYTQLILFTGQSLSNYTATRTIGSGSNSVTIKYTWTTQNGVYGMKLENESLGTSIFFPASGGSYDGLRSNAGSSGYCWVSTTISGSYSACRLLYFYSGDFSWNYYDRCNGFAVRPLLELAL